MWVWIFLCVSSRVNISVFVCPDVCEFNISILIILILYYVDVPSHRVNLVEHNLLFTGIFIMKIISLTNKQCTSWYFIQEPVIDSQWLFCHGWAILPLPSAGREWLALQTPHLLDDKETISYTRAPKMWTSQMIQSWMNLFLNSYKMHALIIANRSGCMYVQYVRLRLISGKMTLLYLETFWTFICYSLNVRHSSFFFFKLMYILFAFSVFLRDKCEK